ncbi:MAG: NAD regulator [Alphaproteobacteria bacterium]|nr:NAD regulator [Alphaproteobacteria bacterium]MBL6936285.1 NAD regulator [Alphaproteobacteria bacterium]MBL7098664.1 NAD regulator [Alphaproteobacteria bacterium]
MSAKLNHVVSIGLSAAIVSVANERPCVLVVHHDGKEDALPFGPFDPLNHRTLDSGLRRWVGEQTQLDLGYAEQLYTFGDRGRHLPTPDEGARVVSVGYLALTRQAGALKVADTQWSDWYKYFPWEDWREAKPTVIDDVIAPALRQFARAATGTEASDQRRERIRLCFGFDGLAWDEEKVLERYELLYEAGLVQEALRDGRAPIAKAAPLGVSMTFDHRRILATAIARLRGKMKYRPVVFELMPPSFTLLELQRTVEALSGIRLHKQNFRRLVEDQGLVEGTGRVATQSRGRPAELFRFRREVLRERPAPGVRLGARKAG